ncbi:MAG: lysophospholipase [Bacteroidota bacterium]
MSTSFSLQHGQQLFAGQHWPVSSPKAVYGIIHGHGEHVGRYGHVAAFLNQAEIAVAGYDHYGHGKTEGKKGHFPSYEAVLDSMDAFLGWMRATYPGAPIFLFGQSMGSNLLANYLLQRKPDIQGAVLSSPWFRLAMKPSSMDVFLAKMMLNIYPSFTQSSKLDAQGLSHRSEVVKTYQEDPLVHDLVSPVVFASCVEQGEKAIAMAGELSIPTLLMHGDQDPITSFAASESFAKSAPDQLLTWRVWPGMKHELHNETVEAEVLAYTLEWLETQLKTIPSS